MMKPEEEGNRAWKIANLLTNDAEAWGEWCFNTGKGLECFNTPMAHLLSGMINECL